MQDFNVSPSNVLVYQQKSDGEWIHIANATNLTVQLNRQKMPIFAFGSDEYIHLQRGMKIITGSIDMIELGQNFYELLSGVTIHMTEIEKNALANQGFDGFTEVETAGYPNSYTMEAFQLDQLPAMDIRVVGYSEQQGNYSIMEIKGFEVLSVSNSRQISDVVQLERIEWFATDMKPWMPNN